MSRFMDVGSSALVSLGRLGLGMAVGNPGKRPEKTLELYEFEACPFCRKVREALSILDLEVIIKPCPKRGRRFRPQVEDRGGRALFPYLVDPNSGVEIYESETIVAYLFEQYGDGRIPMLLDLRALTTFGSVLAGLPRLGAGGFVKASRAPKEMLTLYSFEASPFCRLVRESLCSLELPYRLVNVAKGSPSRAAFIERSGRMRVPWLYDPNTGVELFESDEIVRYLHEEYADPGLVQR